MDGRIIKLSLRYISESFNIQTFPLTKDQVVISYSN